VMSYYLDYEEDYEENYNDESGCWYCGGWGCYECDSSFSEEDEAEYFESNSANEVKASNVGEKKMAQVGTQFTTGNSVVKSLKVGTVLEVVAPSTLEVVSVAIPSPGDRIDTKYGPATVVRKSDRLEFELDENEVLYVADSDPVVRRLAI